MHGPRDARPESVPSNQTGSATTSANSRGGHLAALIGALVLSTVEASDAVAVIEASITSTAPATTPVGITMTATTSRFGVPGAPRFVTARAVGTTAEVRFRPPTSNGGAPIDYYIARCASSNGGVTRQARGRASPINVRSLSAAKTYTCTVQATNANGTGQPSAPSAPFRVP